MNRITETWREALHPQEFDILWMPPALSPADTLKVGAEVARLGRLRLWSQLLRLLCDHHGFRVVLGIMAVVYSLGALLLVSMMPVIAVDERITLGVVLVIGFAFLSTQMAGVFLSDHSAWLKKCHRAYRQDKRRGETQTLAVEATAAGLVGGER